MGRAMETRLALNYDRERDMLYISKLQPYPE